MIFDAETTTARERKQLLRALISEVVVRVEAESGRGECRIVWEGGASSELTVALRRRGRDSARRTEVDTIELIRRLALHYDDATIARLLARQGRVTVTGLPLTRARVYGLRRRNNIPDPSEQGSREPDADMVSMADAEALLGTSRATLYRWLAAGFIAGEQEVPGTPWRIRIDGALREQIATQAPPGWVGLAEAARTLGVARQTVLDRVRRGELNARHVNRGRRKGLAIELPAPQPAFFAAAD